MRTENELAGALRAAAEHAPGEGDLLAGVAARRRRRTRRRVRMLAAAAAVVVLSVGVRGIVLSGDGEVDMATTPRPAVTLDRLLSKPVPVEKLWPEAVFTMPDKNADGMRYHPITSISATEVLLLAKSPEKPGRIEVYDSAAKRSRVVADISMPRTFTAPTLTTDGKNVAWHSYGTSNGQPMREIWTVPLTGGKARPVTTLYGDQAGISAIAIDGDQIIWSGWASRAGQLPGTWRIPLAGGAPERIPTGEELYLVTWPWASNALPGASNDDRNQTKVVDLRSGSTIDVTVRPGTKGLRCGPRWCFGRDGTGGFLQRIDGSMTRGLDGFGDPKPISMPPILDRFVALKNGVYDTETGRSAAISGRGISLGMLAQPSTVIYWAGKPGTYRVLNLAAVPPAQ
ncbi:TolB family protein [Nonomuraea sp. H19]|uniref:TolB family protein n=1 Tax=Nonomuraea sp. H19 TaxID=3452206 RepID=UPI003F8A3846